MLDVEQLRKENELARQEVREYCEQNSFKNRSKEWFKSVCANSRFLRTISNIRNIFMPEYDNVQYGSGDCWLQFIIYSIFKILLVASCIKIGFDYNIFQYILIGTLIVELLFDLIIFRWQAIVSNLIIYFATIFITCYSVKNAFVNDMYHQITIEQCDSTITTNDFFEKQITFLNIINK